MRKIIVAVNAAILITLLFSGCQGKPGNKYEKYTETFYDAFDTKTTVVGYTETKEKFMGYFEKIQSEFMRLHKLYDIYNNYDGISNIKTINDNAGIMPVKVDKDIIDLILFSKEWCSKTNGKTNIALGPMLSIWHNYRTQGIDDPSKAKLPPMDMLREAMKHTDINKVIVDTQNSTVFLSEKGMSLDVGAVAKGYATEIVAQEIMADGFTSGIISAGGNIRTLDKPLDGERDLWGIGLQNPDKMILPDADSLLDIVFCKNASVVSSGDYERYYVVDGKMYHHLIDPQTLMPGKYYRAVTILTENSGIADALSTAVFLMPYEEGRKFVESLDGVEALWVMPDGRIEATPGFKSRLQSSGATAKE